MIHCTCVHFVSAQYCILEYFLLFILKLFLIHIISPFVFVYFHLFSLYFTFIYYLSQFCSHVLSSCLLLVTVFFILPPYTLCSFSSILCTRLFNFIRSF